MKTREFGKHPPRSVKAGLYETFEHMVVGFRCDELSGEPFGAEEWCQTRHDGTLALGVLARLSAA